MAGYTLTCSLRTAQKIELTGDMQRYCCNFKLQWKLRLPPRKSLLQNYHIGLLRLVCDEYKRASRLGCALTGSGHKTLGKALESAPRHWVVGFCASKHGAKRA